LIQSKKNFKKKLELKKEWMIFELGKVRVDMTVHAEEIASKIRNILKAKIIE